MRSIRIRDFIIIFILNLSISGCSSDSGIGSARKPKNPGQQCNPSLATQLSFRESNSLTSNALTQLNLLNPKCVHVYATADSDCGEAIEFITPDTWLLSSDLAQLSTQGEEAELCFHRGATGATPLSLTISQAALVSPLEINVRWTPTETPGLVRWYRADSFNGTADNTVVAINNVSPWLDVSGTLTPYNSYGQTGREPLFKSQFLGRPSVQICGGSAGCANMTNNKHLRVASSFNDFANSDFTIFVAVARATAQRNYLLVNQSNGNNTGHFMGWTSNTNFRVGLNGPGGSNFVDATVDAYNGTPSFEIWTARLNTDSHPDTFGLQIYRNGQMLANNTGVVQKPSGAVTIPYIGTQRADHNNANFYLSDWLFYNRALSQTEIEDLTAFLLNRYQ